MTNQEQAEPIFRVHGVVGEQAQVFEQVAAQVVGFVHDEDGLLPSLAAEAGDFVADLAEQGGTVALDGQPHLPGDGLVEIHHVARGEANVQDAMQPGMETGYDLAASGGFAAATFTGGDADAAQLDQMVKADLELA